MLTRKGLNRLGLLGLSTASALGLAELGARIFLPAPQAVVVQPSPDLAARLAAENRAGAEMDFVYGPGEGLYVETPTGRRLRASTVARIHGHRLNARDIEIRTNSLGFRNRELGPKETTRVLFLGDSITFGDYVDENETFVRRIEALSRDTATPMETVNAGVGAIGLEDELALLLETGLSAEPDVVVLGFYLNDAAASRRVESHPPPAYLSWSRLANILADRLARTPGDALDLDEERRAWLAEVRETYPVAGPQASSEAAAFNRRIHTHLEDWGGAWSEGAWSVMEPLLVELARLADEHDFQLLWVCFPVRAQVKSAALRDFPQRKLTAIADRLDVPLLDLLPLFRETDGKQGPRVFLDQCHHSAYGNRLIAEWIHDFLQAELAR